MSESGRPMTEEANYFCLDVLRKTRTEPTPGDLFAVKVKGRGYFCGAVVKTGVNSRLQDSSTDSAERRETPDILDLLERPAPLS